MCGIVGVVGSRPWPEIPIAAVETLVHRGPDDVGRHRHTGLTCSFSIAHTRLAVNDLSAAGRQPMASDDGQLVMAFNGEIYNSPELRKHCESRGRRFRSRMDGEVILHLWALEGYEGLRRLNGIFALALADTRLGEVTLARDPLGVKPLAYCVADDGSLAFASELRALRALGSLGVDLGSHDVLALAQFLTFLWVPDPRTPYAGVRTVEPGGAVRWTQKGIQILTWASAMLPTVGADRPGEAESVERGRSLVEGAVRRQLLSDVPVGLMASGGVDSGLLWWAGAERLERAYTITWESPGVERLDEDAVAVRRCQLRFRTPVRYLSGEGWDPWRMPTSGDLIADPAYELTRRIAKAAREDGFKVLLSGQGGDEIFGGYRRHRIARILSATPKAFGEALSRIADVGARTTGSEYLGRLARALRYRDPFHRYMSLCSYSTAPERARILGTSEGEVADERVWERHLDVHARLSPQLSFLRKVLTVDLLVYLPGLGLAYADRAAMEEGIEVRVPLLDLDLVRWSMGLPDDLLVRKGQGKWLAKKLAASVLPRSTVLRPKRGFGVPVGSMSPEHERGRQGAYLSRAAQQLQTYLVDH